MSKLKVFMIMPFEDDYFEVYEMIKRKFGDSYEFSNAEEEGNQQNIIKDIIQPIYDSDVIIADLTGNNPNVFYELGVAHTLNKKVIIITKNIESLPFDLKSYRVKEYDTHYVKFEELVVFLTETLKGIVDDNITFSNPVTDFLGKKSVVTTIMDDKTSQEDSIFKGERGFLDFIADIEENINVFAKNIDLMTEDMQTMSAGVNHCTEEIDRVNNSGGNGTATFVRKEAKKVAKYMNDFSLNLRKYNEKYTGLWNEIEKDTIGLLENKIAGKKENKESLVEYLKSLFEMRQAVFESCDSVEILKTSSLGNQGLERNLNQSIRFLDEDLKNYLAIMKQVTDSIDRIFDKSKFVVGEILFEQRPEAVD